MPKNSVESYQEGDKEEDVYQAYIDFFEEVYDAIEENYFKKISREDYDRFIDQFNTKIYAKLKFSNKERFPSL